MASALPVPNKHIPEGHVSDVHVAPKEGGLTRMVKVVVHVQSHLEACLTLLEAKRYYSSRASFCSQSHLVTLPFSLFY